MKILKWVFQILVFLCIKPVFSTSDDESLPCSASDRAALMSFKSHISKDTTGILDSWVGYDCSSWEGIQCNPSGRVISLSLQRRSDDGRGLHYMQGTLSPSLANLSFLETIMLSGLKQITGPIPDSYMNLKQLKALVLEDLELNGIIPSQLSQLQNLQALSLSGNRFHGPLPSSLGSLSSLIEVNLARNFIHGIIPTTYKGLHSLQFLDLGHNRLSGSIPNFIGPMQNITYLDLSNNHFYGEIPTSICSLSNAGRIDLSWNNLSGQIPSQIGVLKSLTFLSLAGNHLTGYIPQTVANLKQLSTFDVSRNHIKGSLPNNLEKGLKSITSMDLSHNKLSLGVFPNWLKNRVLYDLRLARCGIQGNLPNFSNTDNFHSLDLSGNRLAGSIGSYLTKLENVEFVDLSNNLLASDVSEIIVPYSVSFLDLHGNKLHGLLPRLFQKLPRRFMKVIDLSRNNIEGNIPDSVANLTKLQKLDLSRNEISGFIPSSLGNLQSLEWLDLSHNALTGRIPSTIVHLKKLKHIDFRGNKLCGLIPQEVPWTIFPATAYGHNKCLCGKPLLSCKGIHPK